MIRPANGSASVLKTNAAVSAPSISIGAPFFAGEGTPSTMRSSKRVRAEVLRRDPARDREHLALRDRELERGRNGVGVELLATEVLLHQRLVGLDDLVEELLAVLLRELHHLLGDRGRLALLGAVRARVGAHVEDVDDAGELVLGADRQVDGDAARRELLLDLGERAVEVGALPVEHVHEEDAREAEIVGEMLDPRGADLEAHHRVDDDERALDDAQRTPGLTLEARVARGRR